jgi:hypothetical protein
MFRIIRQEKQAKLQWLQNSSQMNGNNRTMLDLKLAELSAQERGNI